MDDAVVRAMARWPNVPHVYGWLSLDRRGQWRLQGGTIGNVQLRDFISRNYFAVGDGSYAFQNGPQRVFVALEYAPWVTGLDGASVMRFHTGAPVVKMSAAWMDELGNLLLMTEQGLALLDDRDLDAFTDHMCDAAGKRLDEDQQAAAVEALLEGTDPGATIQFAQSRIPLAPIRAGEVAARFGLVREPKEP